MSTNAVIEVEGIEFAEIWKHWDGYPEATLPWLTKFNKEFTEKRGDDPEYKFAQLLRSTKVCEEEFGLDRSDTTGWGVMKKNQMDGSYKYILKKDGTVEVE